ncbi:MAG: hypothetical protein EXX96DRAFT_375772 [Benjaminiella poitrasii]|nr:MAG: hypothetical protein EXX96DRAFT_375772 [Benjaminiella poitrasii]
MANPRQCKSISALPDRTPGASKGLITGEKWTNHPLFQLLPQTTVNAKNFWIGDVVNLYGYDQKFLVKSFFSFGKEGTAFVDGYFILENNNNYGVAPDLHMFPQQNMICTVDKDIFNPNNCCTLGLGIVESPSLSDEHARLLFGQSSLKIEKHGKPGEYLKVAIAPIFFFTDDTSGGTSKQHIQYESWSMTYAALPLEDRGRRENTMFIGCAPKSDGVNAMHFIPGLSADMKALEAGVVMFSSEHNELVLVKASLMFISADNPTHSDICGLMQQATLYFCRICYFMKANKKKASNSFGK